MAASISASVGSYQSGARNLAADVRTVQELLTKAAKNLNSPAFDPKGIDGQIARVGSQSNTVKAIANFQKQQVGMASPDQRIDVNGNTFKKLVDVSGPVAPRKPAKTIGLTTLTVTHGGKIPTNTKPRVATASGLYESTFTLSGSLSGTFLGSIYPDDMTVYGRVDDGTYPLHIGFHLGGGEARQTAADLVVKTKDIRAGLLVNARNSVPVDSDARGKTTANGINVHNGGNSSRGSKGCLTLPLTDWAGFIQLFLDAFPNIEDWHTLGDNTGKQIGTLVIKK